MARDQLFTPGDPCFYLVQTDESAFENLKLQLIQRNKEHIIRMIRGNKSSTREAFFNESAAALQFPYYFGENWNAFEECMVDLDWLEGGAYLLLVNNASELLCDADDEDFRLLLKALARAHAEWLTPNTYIPRNRLPTPFHILFQCTAADSAVFSQRLTHSQLPFELFVDTGV
jgi:hypothetical protein